MPVTNIDVNDALSWMADSGEFDKLVKHAPTRREASAIRKFKRGYDGFREVSGRMPAAIVMHDAPRTVLADVLAYLMGEAER